MSAGRISLALRRTLPKTLLGKTILTLLAVVTFGSFVIAVALSLKSDLQQRFEALVDVQQQEHILQLASATTTDLLIDLSNPHSGGGPDDRTVAEWETHLLALAALDGRLPGRVLPAELQQHVRRILEELANYRALAPPPERIDGLAMRLRAILGTRVSELRAAIEAMGQVRAEREARYRRASDSYALVVLGVGLAGLIAAGIVIGRFFTQLTNDLQKLGMHVKELVTGRYARSHPLTRNDEVAQLAQGIDAMAATLERQEKEMELFRARFQHQEKMFTVGTFAAGIAHEIGNPLQTILAICEHVRGRVLRASENAAEIDSELDMIAIEAGRLAATIQEISAFARPGPGEMQPTNVNEVVRTTIHLLRFDPRFRSIHLITDLDTAVPMIRAVGDHLVQVLMNVLINAADAIAYDSGKITVSTRQEDGFVSMNVVDDGSGMSQEILDRATDAFFTTKPRGKGTGLGLAVCKTIINEHAGDLSIESAPDQGTTVSIRIPTDCRGMRR